MPQLASITVKNSSNADVVYEGVVASSGDKSPAIWRSPTATAPAFRPQLKVVSQSNAQGNTRVLTGDFRFPVTATAADGSTKLVDLPRMEIRVYDPQAVNQDILDNFIAQGLNLFSSALFREMAKTGYAAT